MALQGEIKLSLTVDPLAWKMEIPAEQPTNLPPARSLLHARNHDHGNGKWRHAVQLPISVEARAARLRRRSQTQYDG